MHTKHDEDSIAAVLLGPWENFGFKWVIPMQYQIFNKMTAFLQQLSTLYHLED